MSSPAPASSTTSHKYCNISAPIASPSPAQPSPAQPSPARPRRPGSGDHLSNGNSPLHRNQKVTFPITAAASCTAAPSHNTTFLNMRDQDCTPTLSVLCVPIQKRFCSPLVYVYVNHQDLLVCCKICTIFGPFCPVFLGFPPGRYRMSLQARPCPVCRLQMVMDI